MKNFYIILIILLTGCQLKTGEQEKSESHEDLIPRKGVEVFGDTLKIVYEYHGDTVIQYRIDLKGGADDGFDASFTVKSVWRVKKGIELDCSKTLTLTQGKIDFIFCLNDVIQQIMKEIETSEGRDLKDLNAVKGELVNIRNGSADTLTFKTYRFTFDLLQKIDFSIIDTRTKSKVKKVWIEQYDAGFAGGYNYLLIGDKGDTLASFEVNDWMR